MNIMKNKVYSFLFLTVLVAALQGCAKWEEYNTNPYGVTNEMLSADFTDVGAYSLPSSRASTTTPACGLGKCRPPRT